MAATPEQRAAFADAAVSTVEGDYMAEEKEWAKVVLLLLGDISELEARLDEAHRKAAPPELWAGQRVRVEFDEGWGYARVEQVLGDHVRVAYDGPSGAAYTTSLPRHSVHPA